MIRGEVANLLLVILVAILTFVILLILLNLIVKLVSFKTLKPRVIKTQMPQLVKKKVFITSDGYELRWFGEVKPKSKVIVLGVHDLGLNSQEFNAFETNLIQDSNFSFVSFDQRYFGQNQIEVTNRKTKLTFNDLKEIILELKKLYPTQKIVLLGSGFGANQVTYFLKSTGLMVDGVILSGMVSQWPYKKDSKMINKLIKGMLFAPNLTYLQLPFEGIDYTLNQKLKVQVDEAISSKGKITVTEYFQIKTILKRSLKAGHQLVKPVLVVHSSTDLFVDKQKATKFYESIVVKKELIEWPESNHGLILNDSKKLVEQIRIWLSSFTN